MRVSITLDLEPDFGGWIPEAYTAWDAALVQTLLDVLDGHGVPLTVFVVGRSLGARPDVVDLFRDRGAEFHLHSFSHDLGHPDSREEIARGADAFARVFGRRPEGYRAPQGRISSAGWRNLEAEGFAFDSSIFPSFWPAPRYLRFPPTPFRPAGTGLIELPISVVTRLRVVVGLSWMNLLGWPRYRRLLERANLPDPLVFAMHLHDLWDSPSYAAVPRPWRWLYTHDRNQGLGVLERFLAFLRQRDGEFTTLGAVARELRVPAC